jgi:uracil-DNA glycosylase
MVHFENDWDTQMQGEFDLPYYQNLRRFLIQEYRTQTIYPGMYDIYNAMKYTSFHSVRAVILGQDPYHGPNQAHGLSFSVRKGVAPPPSLVNIFKEIRDDTGIDNLGRHGELTAWAKSGVLLLNSVLTVRAGQAASHRNRGWEQLTDHVIQKLNARQEPVVFLLWGAQARAKQQLITAPQHLVLTAAHPSPLSAYNGFFGCRHFSKTNAFLRANGLSEIDWRIGD